MSRKIRFSKESQSSLNDFFVHRSPEQPKSKAEENLPAGILSAFRTDVGKVRANNQDAPIVSEKLRLYGVADGMGGHKGGEVASTSARDDLLRELEGKTPSVAALSGAGKAAVITAGILGGAGEDSAEADSGATTS